MSEAIVPIATERKGTRENVKAGQNCDIGATVVDNRVQRGVERGDVVVEDGSPRGTEHKLPRRVEPNYFFKTLVDHEVTVELKNDIQIRGTLKSVDQYLNIKLDDIQVVEELKYPHLSSVKNVFIRGSVVRYVHLPGAAVDTALLEDATRREAAQQASKVK
ncbi:Sm-like ribonucleoprotein [Glarea lozoyensis ATCC 20868]|uniref:Sm-like ribonucleoprotein n=1 Tax=Glarea lozoyensis (strain ATCC 20868 / MF5171) TaxID=1116229 RepID=S3DXC4_GLAL2|nr:Sm-like ribonucleoprotein [Glarea lozoyensis ATCC 20868]EPE36601.1 Sm-like ribonucleoprotein [Glarea lozoyensis ATCC 20868]